MSDPDRRMLDAYAAARKLLGDCAYVGEARSIHGHTYTHWIEVGIRKQGHLDGTRLGTGATWEQALAEAAKTMSKQPSTGRVLRLKGET